MVVGQRFTLRPKKAKVEFSFLMILGTDHLTWRGGYGFFSKKIFWFPMLLKKNILILVEEKKNNLIQSFCHIT